MYQAFTRVSSRLLRSQTFDISDVPYFPSRGGTETAGLTTATPSRSADLADPLVGAVEMVDGGGLIELKGDAELKGIEDANMSLKAVHRDDFACTDEVDVEQTEVLMP